MVLETCVTDESAGKVLQELGLPEDPNVPMLAFIGRLDEQKGVDLIRDSFDWLMSEGVQLILLGSGREDLENSLRYKLSWEQPSKHHYSSRICEGGHLSQGNRSDCGEYDKLEQLP